MKPRDAAQNEVAFPALSKRAARRVIQRAFVLVGRDKAIRQHFRESTLTTHWSIEDWGLEWTVTVQRGRFEFHRGRVGRPQLTCAWRSAEEFFNQIESGASPQTAWQCQGSPEVQRLFGPVIAAFLKSLSGVLHHPLDDDGERLL